MSFVSLYRKYRSQTFADLVGQEHVVRTLQNAIRSGRFSHAYLFTGPRGTGKTSAARLLAKALCCEHGPSPEPCNECWICQEITSGGSMDVVEIDAASESGVEEVREKIVDRADYQPAAARFKVFIIDEVHDLSAKAFDALLKTIEEPPAHLVFVLATTEFNKVPRTIQSRCQKFEFHRGSLRDLSERLEYVAQQESIAIEPAAIATIARMADGGYRDALTLLEQASLTAEGTIDTSHVFAQFGWVDDARTDAILLGISDRDVPGLLEALENVFGSGRDPRAVVESLLFRLSELTEVLYSKPDRNEKDAAIQASRHETAVRIGPERLLALRGALAQIHRDLRDISLPRIWLESELLDLARTAYSAPKAAAEAPVSTRAAVSSPEPGAGPKPKPEPKAEPIGEPKPESEPEPKANVKEAKKERVPEPEPESVPEIVATGDPEFDRARRVWRDVVAELSALSKTMALKLGSTEVAAYSRNHLEVRFERKIELDALVEGSKGEQRRQAIQEAVRKHAGEPWDVDYTVSRKTNGEAASPAVELPVEGERLVELTKDVLGGH